MQLNNHLNFELQESIMNKLGLFLLLTLVCLASNDSVLSGQGPTVSQEATATVVRVPAASATKMGPLTVTVELIGGQKITGALTDSTKLPIRTVFGAAEPDYSEIAGVKLASAEDTSTTVIFKNGDSVTGATDLKTVSVDTEWGSAKINGSSIATILFLPDMKWTSSMGMSGKRWSLVDSKSMPGQPGQPGQMVPPLSAGQNVSGSRPTVSLPIK